MIMFQSDYLEGAHPEILKRLMETNDIQRVGYGEDIFSESARKKIKKRIGRDDVDIHFIVGGTITNLLVISSALRQYQGVISPKTGHINVHETGAVEVTGHKVITVDGRDGKLSAEDVKMIMENHLSDPSKEHTVQPKMVYISFPTENGTIYSKKELEDIRKVTKEYDLYLFIDGARLGYGLASPDADLTIEDIANLSDVFYIGGTKCGAFSGEAVVISNSELKKDFKYNIKARGAMLAKGSLNGIQFDTLFTDDLYFKITKDAVGKALKLKDAFTKKGIKLFGSSSTNQIFPVLSDSEIAKLREKYLFETWGKNNDGKTIVRFCTSWNTKEENLNSLIEDIEKL